MQTMITVVAVCFLLWVVVICMCLCKVASDADDWMEEMMKRKDEE